MLQSKLIILFGSAMFILCTFIELCFLELIFIVLIFNLNFLILKTVLCNVSPLILLLIFNYEIHQYS